MGDALIVKVTKRMALSLAGRVKMVEFISFIGLEEELAYAD